MVPAQLPFQLLFEALSGNRAGGSYDNHYGLYAHLQQHSADLAERDMTRAHRDGLARERKEHVYRFVNGIEAGVPFLLVTLPAALPEILGLGLVIDTRGLLGVQVVAVALGNLAIGCAWFGRPHQWPEALWQHDPSSDSLWPLHPLRQGPKPSY